MLAALRLLVDSDSCTTGGRLLLFLVFRLRPKYLSDKNTPVSLFLLLSITTTPEPALLYSCLFFSPRLSFPAKHYTQNKIDQLKSRQFNNLSVVGWNYAGRATTLFPLCLLHDYSLQNVGWLAGWVFVFYFFCSSSTVGVDPPVVPVPRKPRVCLNSPRSMKLRAWTE
jgi:hypothetical protein